MKEYPGVMHIDTAEWTLDCECQACGWPWRLYGVSESRVIDIHKTVTCPNCGASHTLDIHHE
jgi:ribosomal protein S27AE